MKYLKNYLILLGILAISSCSRETERIPQPLQATQICLSFIPEEYTSRAELNSSDVDYRNISTVFLYIFEGETADAPCIFKQDIKWNSGNVTQKYWISHNLKPEVTYTYLAVGWDKNSGEVYSLPDGITENKTTLREAMITLAPGQYPEQTLPQDIAQDKKNKMAKAEIYAGQCVKFLQAGQQSVDVNLVMRRKMAGIITYLRSIPYKVNGSIVSRVEVRLHQPQNTEFPLWNDKAGIDHFGTSPLKDDDKVLQSWDMSAFENNGDIYTSKEKENQLENTILGGAFLLPIENTGGQPTLTIVLCDTAGNELKTYDVKHKNQLNFNLRENCLYSMGTKISANSVEEDSPADLSGKFIDLKVTDWTEIISNQGFESIQGVARILSNISPDNYIFDAPGTTFDIFIKKGNPLKRWTLSIIYDSYTDSWGITHPTGNPEFGNDGIHDDLKDWIHLQDLDAEGNAAALSNKKVQADGSSQIVRIVINDYAIQRNLTDGTGDPAKNNGERIASKAVAEKFKNDIRTAYLKIETDGCTPLYYRIRQYNALTIHTTFTGKKPEVFNPDKNPYRAAARLDYGWKFNEQTGKPEQDTTAKIIWGFQGSITNVYTDFGTFVSKTYMSVDDGEMNTKAIMRKCEDTRNHDLKIGYNGCAVKKTKFPILEIRTRHSAIEETNTGHYLDKRYWYLPAQNEMIGITKNFKEPGLQDACYGLFNMTPNTHYWTSTDDEKSMLNAKYVIAADGNNPQITEKTNTKAVRQVRHFIPKK